MSDRRRNIRVEHRAVVEVTAASGTISAQSIDLSRTGIGVVVRVPEDYSDVRKISFHLPSLHDPVQIPVHVVRTNFSADRTDHAEPDDEQILALAFEYEADAQRLLVDRYIRDMVEQSVREGGEDSESRRVPRCDCSIGGVTSDSPNLNVVSIDNLSTEGALFTFRTLSRIQTGLRLRLTFQLPGDARSLEAGGEIVYVVENNGGRIATAGFRFVDLREPYKARIRAFVVENASTSSRRKIQEWFAQNHPDDKFETVPADRARTVLAHLIEDHSPIHAITETADGIYSLYLSGFRDGSRLGIEANQSVGSGQVSCSFSFSGGTYYFRSHINESDLGKVLEFPSQLFRGEVRSYGRKAVNTRIALRVPAETAADSAHDLVLTGRILDISRRGFLCDVRCPVETATGLRAGLHVAYEADESLALGMRGEIRHARTLSDASESSDVTVVVRIGIEADIARVDCRHMVYTQTDWERAKQQRAEPTDRAVPLENKIVRIRNRSGQDIVAILTANRWHAPATVFVAPPAFGKKKETLAPLAAVLLDNFSAAGRTAVVVRYDGIDRPGESYNRNGETRRGFEMLGYRVSQGQDDIQTVLDYAYQSPYFSVERVVLVTFSMASLDGRKLILAEENRQRVHFWLNVMGLPAARTTLRNILGGLDVLANFRMGIPNGVSGMLGHLVNMDTLANDLISHRYAYLTDARLDLSRMDLPVSWICGTFDRWIDAGEIRDIMTIASDGTREIVEIPTGHNLHTSEDALLCYKIMTEAVFRTLFEDQRTAQDPNRDRMFRLIASERERLARVESDLIDEYWHDYLIGKGRESQGYDFYRNIPEFRAFLRREAELLDVRPGARIADLGCGTGLFVETLLLELAGTPSFAGNSVEISAVDLVQEALEKTRQKAEGVIAANRSLSGVRLSLLQRNLEPNRLMPLRRYLASPAPDIGLLRGRVEGLRQEAADRLDAGMSEELDKLLRGAIPSRDLLRPVSLRIGSDLMPIVLELNRAARFGSGRLFQTDLRGGDAHEPGPESFNGEIEPALERPLSESEYETLTTKKMRFDTLGFGDCNRLSDLGFAPESFDRIVASLFVSYLFNVEEIFPVLFRMLVPGGLIVASSMKPDSDISVIFTDYVGEIRASGSPSVPADTNLTNARAMLNEAAALFELEEEGLFKFFTQSELTNLLIHAGFVDVTVELGLGTPPQALIARGRKPVSA
ncbi:MAG TPA: PilZ domain-containing protein [Spirochaetia bacterium]|nr:PilZ domain-containing protein [Spirochaetia bacterium]